MEESASGTMMCVCTIHNTPKFEADLWSFSRIKSVSASIMDTQSISPASHLTRKFFFLLERIHLFWLMCTLLGFFFQLPWGSRAGWRATKTPCFRWKIYFHQSLSHPVLFDMPTFPSLPSVTFFPLIFLPIFISLNCHCFLCRFKMAMKSRWMESEPSYRERQSDKEDKHRWMLS